MKKYIKIILILFFIINTCLNGKYIWQNINSQERDILLIDSLNFYIVGEDGKILKSSDGGKKWVWQESYIKAHFLGVNFYNVNHGFVVGDSGFVLSTINGGRNWVSKKVGQDRFNAVKMLNDSEIIIAGDKGIIYKSNDYGINWSLKYQNDSTNLNRIKFVDEKTGYIVGNNNFLLKSSDGGLSWNKIFQYNQNINLNSIDFFDLQFGIAGGIDTVARKSVIYFTSNSGQVWKLIKTNFWADWHGIKMYGEKNALLFSNTGLIMKTKDLFVTFVLDTPTTKEYLNDFPRNISIKSVSALSNGTILCVGWNHGIIKSSDSGNTCKIIIWFDLLYIFDQEGLFISNLFFLGNDIALMYGQTGQVFRSSDGGIIWNNVYPRSVDFTVSYSGSRLFSHYFKSSIEGFIAGNKGNSLNESLTIFTSDGGITWTKNDKARVNAMCFADENTGFGTADSTFWKTTDGGNSWTQKVLFDYAKKMHFNGIDFKNPETGYIYGQQSRYPTNDTVNFPYKDAFRLLKTTDGGISFDTILTDGNTKRYIRGAYFFDMNTAFLYGHGSALLKTTDGGISWLEKTFDSKIHDINSLKFFDDKFGIAGATGDTVFITNDGGETWTHDVIYLKSFFYDTNGVYTNITFKNKDTVFLIGSERVVRGVWTDDSTSGIVEKVEVRYNPYFFITISPNPVANYVRFKLYGLYSVNGFPLTIKLMNIFGEEVADLSEIANINNNGSTSEFSTDLNQLPVGIYFIELNSAGYAKVEKFIKVF